MHNPKNRLKAALKAGEVQYGLWMSCRDPLHVEMLAGVGFDWVLIDMEHAPLDPVHVAANMQATSAYPVSTAVRVAWNDKVLIKRVLDLGAQTIVIPYVQTVDEARAAVEAITHPPHGIRGVAGMTRASRFGEVPAYAKIAEQELSLILQIETAEGLNNLEEIAAVDGVDGLFLGPSDLSASLGFPGEPGHPDVRTAIMDAIRRIRAAGKAAGFLTADPAYAMEAREAGATFLGIDIDVIALKRSVQQRLSHFREN